MAGLGRHQLFQVIKSTPGARLKLEVTATLKADGENQLPPAQVIGTERVQVPFMGRGSARVFVEPIAPQEIAGGDYLAI